jgi:hypothetical protein
MVATLLAGVASPALAGPADDNGERTCVREARRLCTAEMKSMRRKRVEACMIANIERTSPVCHAAMLKIKALREVAAESRR